MNDALMYANIKNMLDVDDATVFATYITHPDKDWATGWSDKDDMKTGLEKVVSSTTIKRACCQTDKAKLDAGKSSLSLNPGVRIPLPAEEKGKVSPFETKWNYFDKSISISPSVYKDIANEGYYKNSPKCNLFYKVYCDNVLKDYKELNNGEYDTSFGSTFKPECACFAPRPDWMAKANINIPSTCFLPGCDDSTAYLDGTSKEADGNQKECKTTICAAIFEFGKNDIEGNASIKNQVNQQCGRGGKDGKPGKPGKFNVLEILASISSVSVSCIVVIAVITIILLLLFKKK